MRDDPWTAANRDKEQLKVTIRPTRKQTAETASPPSKPTVSGPFWTGKNPWPMSETLKASSTRDNAQMIERARKRLSCILNGKGCHYLSVNRPFFHRRRSPEAVAPFAVRRDD